MSGLTHERRRMGRSASPNPGLDLPVDLYGVEIRHDLPSQEAPELVVKVRTAEAGWEAATRAWLQPYEAPEEPRDPATGIPLKHIVRAG